MLLFVSLLSVTRPAEAQYDAAAAFAPFAMTQAVNVYRSSNGLPGPQYWRNRADYTIRATLTPDATAPSLAGDEVITYTNNSPDTLEALWVQLDQNIYKPGSRGAFANGTAPRAERPTASCSTRWRSNKAAGSCLSPILSAIRE
jgi:hypothetical protein